MLSIPSKACKGCGIEKPLIQFWKCAANNDGRAGKCAACSMASHKAWKAENPEKHKSQHKAWRDKNPDKTAAYSAEYRLKNPTASRAALDARRARNPKLEWAKQSVLNSKDRARRKGLAFSITVDDVLPLCSDLCPVLGVTLEYPNGVRAIMGGTAASPSLDRMIPEVGYVKGNIAVVSRRANVIKNDATVEEVRAVLAWMEQVKC